jgi:uncharacterized protein (DUF58 family)
MYLWKDRRLRLNLTRLGMEYLGAMLLVGLVAVNSGNNLLYLVFSLMLSLFLVSGWVSRAALQDIRLEGVEEGNIFARVRGGIKVRLQDRRPRRLRALEVRLDLEEGRAEPGFYGGGVRTKEEGLVVLHARVERRGWCRLGELELKTAYPFGFIEKSWRFPLGRQVLVLPHPRTTSRALDLSGEALRTRPAAGDVSPEGARPYRTGDSTTRVHWKRTAQRRAPWVRTFEGEEAVGLRLRLDLLRWAPGRDFERELEQLSGAILQTRLQKREVSLEIHGTEGLREFSGHPECWRALALAQAEGDGPARPRRDLVPK